jgi:hypothetical protein
MSSDHERPKKRQKDIRFEERFWEMIAVRSFQQAHTIAKKNENKAKKK